MGKRKRRQNKVVRVTINSFYFYPPTFINLQSLTNSQPLLFA